MSLEQPASPGIADILLVDDHPENLLALESMLSGMGQEIFKARSGEEALKCLLRREFAVILLDVKMPGIDGFETAALIRERDATRHTPIIFMTAYDRNESQVFKGYSLGAVDFIFKPVVPEALKSKVGVFVELHRKAEQIKDQAALLVKDNEALEERVAHRTRQWETANAELQASLLEKETLIREVHHRVKNNLQTVRSLLSLQEGRVRDPGVLAGLRDCRERVMTMALVHEKLYRSPNLARIDFADYLRDLTQNLLRSIGAAGRNVRVEVEAEPVALDVQEAIPCGLAVHELVSNALKHAFPDGRGGVVKVGLSRGKDGWVSLSVSDNGVGLPPGLDLRRATSLGLSLVENLAGQLGGTLRLERKGGTAFQVTFPIAGAVKPPAQENGTAIAAAAAGGPSGGTGAR